MKTPERLHAAFCAMQWAVGSARNSTRYILNSTRHILAGTCRVYRTRRDGWWACDLCGRRFDSWREGELGTAVACGDCRQKQLDERKATDGEPADIRDTDPHRV